MSIDLNAFTIREARPSDAGALRRLAELDSSRVPAGAILVGELDGELVAAVPIAGGQAIADPLRSTKTLVSLLGLRAAQLRGLEDRRESRKSTRRPPAGDHRRQIPANAASGGARRGAKDATGRTTRRAGEMPLRGGPRRRGTTRGRAETSAGRPDGRSRQPQW
jgi:hypothetical protein